MQGRLAGLMAALCGDLGGKNRQEN
jgi:hypothetical protein